MYVCMYVAKGLRVREECNARTSRRVTIESRL